MMASDQKHIRISTAPFIAGFEVLEHRGLMLGMGRGFGRTANNKAGDAWNEAFDALTAAARKSGCDAVISMQVQTSSARNGWLMAGDTVLVILAGTGVSLRPTAG